MLVFLGDFKPDYSECALPFDADARLVANLECAVSDNHAERVAKAWPIVFEPAALEKLGTYPFALLSIANNHVGDAGERGFNLLQDALNGQQGFVVGGLKKDPYPIIEVDGLQVAVIASLEPCRARRPELVYQEDVESLIHEARSIADRVFVTPHWGKEGEFALFPSPAQRTLAKSWIAAGADGIFGHHSHCMHGSEWIDGKPVFYCLGNFVFDHEESRLYPLTRISLSVSWQPGNSDGSDQFDVRPITMRNGQVAYLEAGLAKRWEALFSELGRQTAAKHGLSAWVAWLRRVGPVYVPKSDRSWKLRKEEGSLKTWVLWTVWSLLPQTWLLRLGRWFPDKDAMVLKAAMESELVEPLDRGI